jgi:hypothetical protein
VNKFAIGLFLVGAVAVQSANAGYNYETPVNASQYGAFGGVHSARVSGDSEQFIGCAAYGAVNTASTYVACSARDAAGHSSYCATYNPNYDVWQSAMGINGSSFIIFNSDSNGNCTYIYHSNSSTNL